MLPKKILFVLPSFEGAGAQRVVNLILRHLSRDKFIPSLVLFHDTIDYAIPEDVRIIKLDKKSTFDLPKMVWRLSKAINEEKPHVVLSFLTYANLVSILATKMAGHRTNLILSEHTNVSRSLENRRLADLKKIFLKTLYPHSNLVICVSQGVAKCLRKDFNLSEKQVRVIYNSIEIGKIKSMIDEPVSHPWFSNKGIPLIISVGRLTTQKGYPCLLRAFSVVRKSISCRLVILGEGEERKELENLAKESDITQDTLFLGFQKNPFKFMARSDVFALSSLWEGFANVIIEAMVCGVPVLATRCSYGPDEIITDGTNGLLIPPGNKKAMSEAILKLLGDDLGRKRLVEAGYRRAEDFRVEKMVAEYERVLGEVG